MMPTRILIVLCTCTGQGAAVVQGREPPTYCKECKGVHWTWKCSACGGQLAVEHIIPN